MEQTFIEMLLTKETVFFVLFLYLFWIQQQEKKSQNEFITKQQDILNDMKDSLTDLTGSFEKMADNQEKLTQRIEKIEVIVDRREDKRE
jgi:hypothetical protein